MRRRVEALQPFTFESDFCAPKTETAETITLSAAELAALIAETRESTAALVRDETLGAQAERLAVISTDLREALSAIVNLAAHLESAAIDQHDRRTALESVRRLARTLIDNQGELFAKNVAHSPLGNHSD